MVNIYILSHSDYPLPDIENLPEGSKITPILVGSDFVDDAPDSFTPDNRGDNISIKNRNFCELTGLYYIWKNIDEDPDTIVSINHYRRFFLPHRSALLYNHKLPFTMELFNREFYRSIVATSKRLERCDAIVAEAKWKVKTVERDYIHYHIREDWNILKQVVLDRHPELKSAWREYMKSSSKLHKFNMITCRRSLFNEYMSWLFGILFEVEKRVKISGYPYQARVFGFMAERLLTLYVRGYKVNYRTASVAIID